MVVSLQCEHSTANTHGNLPMTSISRYNDIMMNATASQITGVSIAYSTVCSGTYQRKHQSSASLAYVWGIHRGPVNSTHKGPVTRKMLPFDDVLHRSLSNRRTSQVVCKAAGGQINIKMTSYQYRKSHCGDKTILRPSYLHNGISYTGKTTSLYWDGAQNVFLNIDDGLIHC